MLRLRLAMTVKASKNYIQKDMGEVAKYTIIPEPNYPEKGYSVRVPALPGCITYGQTREEALARAKEAIEGFIEGEKFGTLNIKKIISE